MNAHTLWPFAVYIGLVLGLVILMLGLSFLLGTKRYTKTTHEPYESGMPLTGSAQIRLSAHYYLIAMFFVIFDLETVFVLGWAVAVRELGWIGFIEVSIFLGMQLLALLYLWRVGALDFSRYLPRASLRAWRNHEHR